MRRRPAMLSSKSGSIVALLAMALIFAAIPCVASATSGKAMLVEKIDGTMIEIGQDGNSLYWKLGSGEAAGAVLSLLLPETITRVDFSKERGSGETIIAAIIKTRAGHEARVQTIIGPRSAMLSLTFEPTGIEADWLMRLPEADRVVFRNEGRYGVLTKGALTGSIPEGVGRLAIQKSGNQHGVWLTIANGSVPRLGKVAVKNDALEVLLPLTKGSISLGAFKGDSLIAMERTIPYVKPLQQASQKADACSTASPKAKKWRWFSDEGRVFKALRADPREAAFHLGFIQDDNGETFEDVAVGGDLGILHLSVSDGAEMSLTMRGLITARFDVFSNSFDLLNADFLGGPALGYKKGPWSWEAFAYHQSSHLGDEVLEDGGRRRIDYGREVVRFLGAYSWESLRLYAGPSYVLHSLPKSSQGCWTMQAGLEYGFSIWDQPCFAGTDIQSRQENDWNLNLTARVGVDLGNPHLTQDRQYLFLELFQGYSNMGQYYDVWERYAMIGIGYNFR
jgi:hypothetical protein